MINIPASVTEMDVRSFAFCNSLENINVAEGNGVFSSADGVLFNKDKSTLMFCPSRKTGQYIVPNTVTKIGLEAFEYSNLTEVIL